MKSKSAERSEKIKRRRKLFLKVLKEFLIVIAIISIIGISLFYFLREYESPIDATAAIHTMGPLGPALIIIIITLEVVVAFIPGAIFTIAAGYAFGALPGAIFAYLGNIFGTVIAFTLSRRFGRPLIKHLINEDKLNLWDCFFEEKGKLILWLGFIFPIFPSDVIAYSAGISKFKFRSFLTIVCLGYIPNMLILTYFGEALFMSGLGEKTIYASASLFLIILFGTLAIIYLKKNLNKKCNPK